VRGEFAENAIRKDFLPSEIEAIRRAMLPAETVAAKGRMVSAHASHGKFPEQAKSFQSKPSRQLATRSAPLPASLAEPSRTMLRVARLPHVRPNHVRLSTREQTSEPDPFSLSIFHKKAMLAHRPVAPLDHRAFRVTLMMMRERPDAGGCCAGPIWEEAGQHPAVPCRGGSAAGS
jgi:hypothetical protein